MLILASVLHLVSMLLAQAACETGPHLSLDGRLAGGVQRVVGEVTGPRLARVLHRVPLAEQLLAARRGGG